MIATTRGIAGTCIEALEEADLRVGDGAQPDDSGWAGTPGASTFRGYVTFHTIPGGDLDGSIGEPHDVAEQNVQLTCVGATRDQAELIADRARTALLEIEGFMHITVDLLSGARRDDTVEPPVWITTDRFCVYVQATEPGS